MLPHKSWLKVKSTIAVLVSAIVVSNHGGRQLDGVPATIDALKDVVEAVSGTGVEVYMDGGVRKVDG